jgi:hypothetical protein
VPHQLELEVEIEKGAQIGSMKEVLVNNRKHLRY